MSRTQLALVSLLISISSFSSADPRKPLRAPAALRQVSNVPAQPVIAMALRVREAMAMLGEPLSKQTIATLEAASKEMDQAKAVAAVQTALDPYCLLDVNINPESRVKVAAGPAKPVLVEQGWSCFLVKVRNEAGVTAELKAASPNALSLFNSPPDKVRDRWLDMQMLNRQPLQPRLSGLGLEYRIVQLYSKDKGQREARIGMNVGQGTQDLGFRNEVDVLFTIRPSTWLTFKVRDEGGKPTTATFVIRDPQGRVYPSQSKRLAPDFAFHPQIYRTNGEKIALPAGRYTIEYTRGPEYHVRYKSVVIGARPHTETFQLERWVDPSKLGWWSGDHHIHAAGCAHYTNPTEGVHAPDMYLHCLGEDLKVGCNLTWGPCFDYQKQFFTGKVDKVSKYPYLLRYDIEVSGFGSHESGHLCLLRLSEQMYPGGTSDKHWPKLGLSTLRWAKAQGAVVGPAHSGWGLEVPTQELPNYIVPPFSGIGANEYIVDVTHMLPGPGGQLQPAVDFISTVDTPYVWELNIWYHTLNCGYRTRISGETDFPCIYGERVGLGRSYVKQDGELNFDAWCEGIRQGRNYVGDGRSHLIDFTVGGVAMGESGSELKIDRPGTVKLTAKVSALLNATPDAALQRRNYAEKPYWSIERARIAGSNEVPLEVIVNGRPVARKNIVADGKMRDVTFDVEVSQSSWVALRILPSSHTNPVFVVVGDKPIRASRRSAEWCLKGVDVCWSQKERHIRKQPEELDTARAAYEHARREYRRILSECVTD